MARKLTKTQTAALARLAKNRRGVASVSAQFKGGVRRGGRELRAFVGLVNAGLAEHIGSERANESRRAVRKVYTVSSFRITAAGRALLAA